MNLTQAKSVEMPRTRRTRVGRGEASGVGKTSGKGHKGARARAGYSKRPYFAGGQMPIIRRIPKRGFHNAWGADYAVINCGDLERFESGSTVDVERLVAAGVVRRIGDGVKLLGDGSLTKKLAVKVHRASASAKAKIEKAGGTVETLEKVTSPRPKSPPAPPKGAAPAAAKPEAKAGGQPEAKAGGQPEAKAAEKKASPPPPKPEKKE
jgi:large subunit ribosomal protein L15